MTLEHRRRTVAMAGLGWAKMQALYIISMKVQAGGLACIMQEGEDILKWPSPRSKKMV